MAEVDSPWCGECSHGRHLTGRCWACFGKQGTRPHPTCCADIVAEIRKRLLTPDD